MPINGTIDFMIEIGEEVFRYKNDGDLVIITNLDRTRVYTRSDIEKLAKQRFNDTEKMVICCISYFEDFIRIRDNPGETNIGFIQTILRPDYSPLYIDAFLENLEDTYAYYQYIYDRPELSPKQVRSIKIVAK